MLILTQYAPECPHGASLPNPLQPQSYIPALIQLRIHKNLGNAEAQEDTSGLRTSSESSNKLLKELIISNCEEDVYKLKASRPQYNTLRSSWVAVLPKSCIFRLI